MKIVHNRKVFGFWEGMPYGIISDSFKDFMKYSNNISKEKVIAHIESLPDGLCSEQSHDIFTGEEFNSGVYNDGDFTFPIDFLRYYKKYDIGIPPEYEEYLNSL